MSAREQEIIREILETLRVAEPTLLSESVVHANVTVRLANQGKSRPTLDEFESALRLADGAGVLRSDRNALTGGLRWTISAQGRVALKEM